MMLGTYSLSAQRSYRWINPHPTGWNLFDICFSDAETGWAIGEQGTVLLSADSGQHWRTYNLGTKDELIDIHFADARNGWICGKSGDIFHTSDGGRFWGETESSFSEAIPTAIHFFDADTGFVVTNQGFIYASDNQGDSWRYAAGPLDRAPFETFTDIQFIDRQYGWVIGLDGVGKRTIDGGGHWQAMKIPTKSNPDFQFHMLALHFVNEFTGWAVGEEGRIVRTQNGGRLWREQHSGLTEEALLDVHFINTKQGWAVGDNGTLLFTEDGGELWLQASFQYEDQVVVGLFADSIHGAWVVGESGLLQCDNQLAQSWRAIGAESRSDLKQIHMEGESCWFVSKEGELYQTPKPLASWNRIKLPGDMEIQHCFFEDEQHFIALTKQDQVILTQDGGKSWQNSPLSTEGMRYYDAALRKGKNLFVVGAKGLLKVAGSLNQNWKTVALNTQDDLWRIAFAQNEIGWLASLQGNIWKSTDGGESWKQLLLPQKALLSDLAVSDPAGSRVYCTTIDGKLISSFNGGKSWQSQELDLEGKLIRIVFRNEKEGIILTNSRKYYYTLNGGKKWRFAFLPSFVRPKDAFFTSKAAFIVGDQGVVMKILW